ncbi:MAG TPA: gamma carbonic anhydrase family protein [Gemmatimonadaceae bacterium]|nr:gamma carbonic anhydrase family protein [Gemmatimonadaceae bacterium]
MTIHPSAFIHESAVVLGNVSLGEHVSIWPTAVIRADSDRIEIGEGTNIQDGAVIHCDAGIPCSIGKRVSVGHRAVIHGALVQDDCLIGIGAIVLNNAVVGRGSLVGAGAVVTEGTVIPPDSLVLGVPAAVVKQLTPEQRQRIRGGHLAYIELQGRHRAGAFPRHQ